MIPYNLLKKWFDEYEIRARLIPGMISCLPFIFIGLAVPKEWHSKISILLGESIFFIAFCKTIMGFAQAAGNKYQDRIKQEWNGLPSTRFLRKEDSKYSIGFKEKFAKAVQRKLDIDLDIQDDQSIETSFSAIKTYLHKYDKNKKWQIYNIEYGFHRNLCGLRLWLICSHLTVVLIYSLLAYFEFTILSAAMFMFWVAIFIIILLISFTSPKSCKINAEHYAEKAIMTFYEGNVPGMTN